MRQGQAGADADLEDALVRPVVGELDRRAASRMEDRPEDDIVGAREQAVGSEGIVQLQRVLHRGADTGPEPWLLGPARKCPARQRRAARLRSA